MKSGLALACCLAVLLAPAAARAVPIASAGSGNWSNAGSWNPTQIPTIADDVTILNGSSVEMAYEVVTTGQCIYQADPDMRLEYEAKARGMYFDFRPFLLEMRSRCLASL